MALTQVGAFDYIQMKPRMRTFHLILAPVSALVPPIHSFRESFDIQQWLCLIDNDGDWEQYDESEVRDLKPQGPTPLPSCAVLPVDKDDDVDLCLDELVEILADSPISRVKKSKVNDVAAVARDEVDDEDTGGVFLVEQVGVKRLGGKHMLWQNFCNLHCNLPS